LPVVRMAGKGVLIVGAGLTSAYTASLLAEALPQVSLTVWDKARGPGGRMTSSRIGVSPGPTSSVDLGAQYLSPSLQTPFQKEYNELLEKGIIQHLPTELLIGHRHPEGSQHYTASAGVGQIVKHFLNKSGAQLQFDKRVTEVRAGTEGCGWTVITEEGHHQEFGVVILTLPVPQVLQLGGEMPEKIQGFMEKLNQVQYSTRYALGMLFEEGKDLGLPWAARYLPGHPSLIYLGVRGSSVVTHSTVQWGHHMKEEERGRVQELMLEAVRELYPQWPHPVSVRCHRWLYSQVVQGYPGSPGSLQVCQNPPLLMGGDAFTASNFEGCLKSGLSLAQGVVDLLGQQS